MGVSGFLINREKKRKYYGVCGWFKRLAEYPVWLWIL